jgi:hypothetical protein
LTVLDRLGIKYHLTGGIAAIAYGEPRMTQDVDLVMDPDRVVWIRHGSHRSRRDLRRILAGASRDELHAVERMAGEMGLGGLFAEVLEESDEIGA